MDKGVPREEGFGMCALLSGGQDPENRVWAIKARANRNGVEVLPPYIAIQIPNEFRGTETSVHSLSVSAILKDSYEIMSRMGEIRSGR